MRFGTYLSMLLGWIIGGIIGCLILKTDTQIYLTIGGIIMYTVAYFLTKDKQSRRKEEIER